MFRANEAASRWHVPLLLHTPDNTLDGSSTLTASAWNARYILEGTMLQISSEAWLILHLVRLSSLYRLGQSPPDMVIITAIFKGEGVISPYPCPPLYPSKHCLKCWRDTYHVREYARPVLEEWASYVALANIDSECAAGKAWLELFLALLPSLYRPGQSLPRYSVHDCSSRNEAAISPYPFPLLYSPNTALSGGSRFCQDSAKSLISPLSRMQIRAIVLSRRDIYSCQHDPRAEYRPLSVWSRSRVPSMLESIDNTLWPQGKVDGAWLPRHIVRTSLAGLDQAACGTRLPHRTGNLSQLISVIRAIAVSMWQSTESPTVDFTDEVRPATWSTNIPEPTRMCPYACNIWFLCHMKRPKPRNKLRDNDTPGYRKLGILSTYMDDLCAAAAR
nr:hypothetical protein CFP56_12120 [Quercus suber]